MTKFGSNWGNRGGNEPDPARNEVAGMFLGLMDRVV